MRKILLLTAASAAAVACADLRELTFMTANPSAGAITIDGDLGDAAWQKAAWHKTYYRYPNIGTREDTFDTASALLYDESGIYLAIRNGETNLAHLVKNCVKDDDSQIWTDDSAEIYFDPAANGIGFYRFAVNSLGRCDAMWRMDPANIQEDWKSPEVKVAAKLGENCWCVELFAPWRAFHGRAGAKAGDIWTFQHNRYRRTDKPFQGVASSPNGGYSTPTHFGYLYFTDGTPPSAEKVLDIVEKRLGCEWGIEIAGKTYLHDAFGTKEIKADLGRVAAERQAAEADEEKRYAALLEKVLKTKEPVEKLPLPLAGTYDFSPPKTFNGHNGWFRHNPDVAGYVTPHWDWRAITGEKPLKILFMTGMDESIRDAVEFCERFAVEPSFFPGNFGVKNNIWEEAVTHGTPLDKARQFESLLTRQPDVVVMHKWCAKIPSKYRFELERRRRDEGLVIVDKLPDLPTWSCHWREDYETWLVAVYNRIEKARKGVENAALTAALKAKVAETADFGGLTLGPAHTWWWKLDEEADVVVPEKGTIGVPATWKEPLEKDGQLVVKLLSREPGEKNLLTIRIPLKQGTTNAVFTLAAGIADGIAAKMLAVVSAGGRVVAQRAKMAFFPNHDFEPYSLISWDSPDVGRHGELFAPQVVTRFGYRNCLGEGSWHSAIFNARAVPYITRVGISKGKTGGAVLNLRGVTVPWSDRDGIKALEAEDELNPYHPWVKAWAREAFAKKVRAAVPYGVCVWSLGDECWFDLNAGHGKQDAVPFARSLQARYRGIWNLNAARGTSYKNFEEVPHLKIEDAIAKRDWPAWWDHVRYIEKMYTDTMRMYADVIRTYDPKARVGAEGSPGADLEDTVSTLQFWGPYRNLVNDELLRCIAADRVRGIWWGGYTSALRDGFPHQQWEYVLTGTLNSDLWFAITPGSSEGMFAGEMTPQPYVAKMEGHLKELRETIAPALIEARFRKEGFAIYYSHLSARAAVLDDRFGNPAPAQADLIRYCYRTGLGVDFITPRTLGRLKEMKVLLMPYIGVLSDDEVKELKAFVKRGGTIYASGNTGILNDSFVERKALPLKDSVKPLPAGTDDAAMTALLAQHGIRNPESIEGLPGDHVVFRVRLRPDGTRLVGFKCLAGDLGANVTINLGKPGSVREIGGSRRDFGRTDSIALKNITSPFMLFEVR